MVAEKDATTTALAVLDRPAAEVDLYPQMVMTLDVARAQLRALREFVAEILIPGEDYGKIPGTGEKAKPTLLKSGAEKLLEVYALTPEVEIVNAVEDWQGRPPFFYYLVKVRLVSRRSGKVMAEGIGSCNSRESRYADRWVTERQARDQGVDTVELQSKEFVGRYGTFVKYLVPNDDVASLVNCVVPETRILTRDLRWVAAGDLRTGDRLIGVEEQGTRYRRGFRDAEAIVYGRKRDDLYAVRLADGRTVRCNGEHKWLVKKVGLKGTEWAATSDIFKEIGERHGRPRHWQIMSLCCPWSEEDTKESGYMAGLLDADGTLGACGEKYQQVIVQFAQQSNGVLARMKDALTTRAFAFGEVASGSKVSREPVVQLRVHGGLAEQMRFLGTIRPPRLLERWRDRVRLEERRFEGEAATIEAVEAIGPGEIVLLGSTAGTYIAEGLVAHNTIQKMAEKRALIGATLKATRASGIFTQDLEDIKGYDPDGGPVPAEPVGGDAPRQQRPSTTTAASQPAPQSRPTQPQSASQRPSPQPTASAGNDKPASAAQARAIYAICRNQHAWEEAQTDSVCQSVYGAAPAKLTAKQASDLITRLNAGELPAAAQAQPTSSVRELKSKEVDELFPENGMGQAAAVEQKLPKQNSPEQGVGKHATPADVEEGQFSEAEDGDDPEPPAPTPFPGDWFWEPLRAEGFSDEQVLKLAGMPLEKFTDPAHLESLLCDLSEQSSGWQYLANAGYTRATASIEMKRKGAVDAGHLVQLLRQPKPSRPGQRG